MFFSEDLDFSEAKMNSALVFQIILKQIRNIKQKI